MTGLAVVRAVHFAAAIEVIGALLFCWLLREAPCAVGGASERPYHAWLMHLALGSLVIVAISGMAWFALQVAQTSDGGLTAAWTSGAVHTVLFKTHAGTVWWVRLGIATALTILIVAFAWRDAADGPALGIAFALAIANLASCAWLSHAAADPGAFGPLHLGVHAAHLLGVSLWLGGFIPLLMLLSPAHRVADRSAVAVIHHVGVRFGDIALFAVALIVLTGVANTALLVEDTSDLMSGAFAKLLGAKLLLLLLMLVLAAYNRQVLLPRLASATPWHAAALLRRSVWAELAIGMVVLLIAGALGITPPGGTAE